MNRPPGNGTPLAFLLGLWIGGSLFMWGVAVYNFSGISHSFEVNKKLAEKAGFDPEDDNAKKTSLIWVHSSELNRQFFISWGHAQLLLGFLSVLAVMIFRQGLSPLTLIVIALLISVHSSFSLTPEITQLGRELDFVSREPEPPAKLGEFNKKHSLSLLLDAIRVGCVLLAGILVMFKARQRPQESYLSAGQQEGTISSSVEDSVATRERAEESPDSAEQGGG